MINALGKYALSLEVISDLSRLHPGGAPLLTPRRAIGGCGFHPEAAGELTIEIDGRFLELRIASGGNDRRSRNQSHCGRDNEHGAALARSWQAGGGSRSARSGLRLGHRRLRHADLKEAKNLLDELVA